MEQSGKRAGLGATEWMAAETGRSGEEGLGNLHPQPRGRGRPGQDGTSPWGPGEATSAETQVPPAGSRPDATQPSLEVSRSVTGSVGARRWVQGTQLGPLRSPPAAGMTALGESRG